MSTRLSTIDFTSDLEKLTKDFTGRQWVFDEIDCWLTEREERFFILTGEPEVGKSAIALNSLSVHNYLTLDVQVFIREYNLHDAMEVSRPALFDLDPAIAGCDWERLKGLCVGRLSDGV